MRTAGLFALAILFPAFAHAAVVINEVAWMGTAVSPNGSYCEWIELANTGSGNVNLNGWTLDIGATTKTFNEGSGAALSIAPRSFYLIERLTSSCSDPVPSISADWSVSFGSGISNNGAILLLKDENNSEIDRVDGSDGWKIGGGSAIKGNNTTKETAQRTTDGWETAVATPRTINVGVSEPPPADDPSPPPADDSSDPTNTPPPETMSSSGGGPAEYLPIPTLQILTAGMRTVSSGAETAFTALVYDSKGNKRDDAVVTWSFGDGMRRTGASVYHEYYDPGEYLAIVRATTSDDGNMQKEVVVTVKDASIKISLVSPRGITLANNDSRTLDLSLWRLSAGGQEFKIPEDTQILAGHTILFSSKIIELPIGDSASLLYPGGGIAATYGTVPVPVGVQPSPSVASYEQVQKVEQIISQKNIVPVHEEAVSAPAAENELAAAGAALPVSSPASTSRVAGIFKSPWTFGFLGVVALAAGAFIFL